jgi:hypothetical protein
MTARRRRRRGWPHTFDHARWVDRLGYIRQRFEAGEDIELLPGELSARLRLIGPARRAFGPMEDVSHDGPWAMQRSQPHLQADEIDPVVHARRWRR